MAEKITFTWVANSPGLLFAIFVLFMSVASVLYGIFEDSPFLDSLYWAVVTATTLGYGDFAPHSTEGKVLTSFLIMTTVFLFLPTITANLSSKLIVDRDVFTHEEQEEIKSEHLGAGPRLLAVAITPSRTRVSPPHRVTPRSGCDTKGCFCCRWAFQGVRIER